MGKPMVMGRKTFDSFPAPLPGRRHIVLTRNKDWQANGAETVNSAQAALDLLFDAREISIIGGAEIYRLFMPLADRVELTHVHIDAVGDTMMDDFDPMLWRESCVERHPAQEHSKIGTIPAHSFVTLVRKVIFD